MPVHMVKQHVTFNQNTGVIPFIGLHLHDDHVPDERWSDKLTEPALIPAILIEVIRVVVFSPRVIYAVIGQFDTVHLPEVAHHQPPAIEMAENKRTLQ